MIIIKNLKTITILLGCVNILLFSTVCAVHEQNKECHKILSTYETEMDDMQHMIEEELSLVELQQEEINKLDILLSEQEDEIIKLKNQQKTNRQTFVGNFNLSFYSKEQFPNSKTATGVTPQAGVTVAVDPNIIPLGTKLYIEGLGVRIAQDTGGAIKGNKMDVFVNTTSEALQLGVKKNMKVWIIK